MTETWQEREAREAAERKRQDRNWKIVTWFSFGAAAILGVTIFLLWIIAIWGQDQYIIERQIMTGFVLLIPTIAAAALGAHAKDERWY